MKNRYPDYKQIVLLVSERIDKGLLTGTAVDEIDKAILNAFKQEKEYIDFTKVAHDNNGNPRYVCHFTTFITQADRDNGRGLDYSLALGRARKIGGGKFHNKQYGGGVVFQSYNIDDTAESIKELMRDYK